MCQGSPFVLFTHGIRRWLSLGSFTLACVLLGNSILLFILSIKSISKQWSLSRVSLCPSLLTFFSIHMLSWGFCSSVFPLLFLFPLETDTSEVSVSSLNLGSDLCSSLGDSCQPGMQQKRQDSGALQKRPQPLGEQFPICAALSPAPGLRTAQLSLCFSHHP